MNGYEEKIKDRLFLEVCNAAGREEWDGLAHQQKENLMLVCRLSGYDEKFQRTADLSPESRWSIGDRRRG
ncbi:hypothetical protein OBE_04245, partial [human gut metagenome]